MRVAAGQIQFDETVFDRLIQKGFDADVAFQRASTSAGTLGQQVTILGRSFSVASVAASAFTAIIGAAISLTKKAISEYSDLAEAVRRLHYETGLATTEASAWVQATQVAGISAATSERALTNFLGKVADLRREQMLGEESTSEFARAIDFLNVSITDGQDNLKDTDQLLSEINARFQEYGSGVRTAEAAQSLFGYSGRYLLPILTDQNQSLKEYMETAQRFGATLSALDRQEYEEFRRSNIKLQFAIQGVWNHIAREWIPVLTETGRITAEVVGIYRTLVSVFWGAGTSTDKLADSLRKIGDAAEWAHKNLLTLLAITGGLAARQAAAATEIARAEEELAQARYDEKQAAEEAADVEKELRRQREETLKQLDELKSKLSEKLLDIERDTSERYNAIFVDRMRDAMERMLRLTWKMDDLRADLNEKLAGIEQDFAERWESILVSRARDAFENQLRTFWRLIDMQRDYEQSRQDVMRDYAEREADLREDTRKKIEDLEEDAREKREDLERDHQERLAKIRQDYLDTVQEAARKNDAVAVARAMREQAREQRDEQKRYTEEQRDLAEGLDKKRQDLEEDRQEREADTQAELERALRRLEENYAEQRRQTAIQLERDRILRELHYGWELEDFNAAKQKQLDDAQTWYEKQYADLLEAQDRENILNEMHNQQQLDDLELARQAQRDEANRQYGLDRDELAEQLKLTGLQLETAYADWILQAGLAAAKAAAAIATSWASEIQRYAYTTPQTPEIQRYGQYLPQPERPAATQAIWVDQGNGAGYWSFPQAPIQMAEGGVIHATSPTTVMMGDRGPETGYFVPGGAAGGQFEHAFSGRVGVDFGGLPGGLNLQQTRAVVYEVVTHLAKSVNVPGA